MSWFPPHGHLVPVQAGKGDLDLPSRHLCRAHWEYFTETALLRTSWASFPLPLHAVSDSLLVVYNYTTIMLNLPCYLVTSMANESKPLNALFKTEGDKHKNALSNCLIFRRRPRFDSSHTLIKLSHQIHACGLGRCRGRR